MPHYEEVKEAGKSAKRPKGSYPLPDGNWVVRQGQITAIHRNPPDIERLAKAFLYLAQQLDTDERQSSSDTVERSRRV